MPEMAKLLEHLATIDGGSVNSPIKGVRFFKNSKQTRRKPLLYTPGICIVASGYKLGHLGGKTFRSRSACRSRACWPAARNRSMRR